MSKTIVIQSHCLPLPYAWLQLCIDSVKEWAAFHEFEYAFLDDELFNYISQAILDKTKQQKVIATDIARLRLIQRYLNEGYDTVVWCDADFVIFNAEKFILNEDAYALGREVWVQEDAKNPGKLSAHVKVHNAFMLYRKDNSFLDFYIETAEKLILQNQGSMPPQFVGPKLLTALHNIAQCPVQESAGMLSPLVIKDIASGAGEALELFKHKSKYPIHAANVCNSLFAKDEYSAKQLDQCLNVLFKDRAI